MIDDDKGAVFYVMQLYNLLVAEDPAMMLGNPFTRAVLLSLCKDLLRSPSLTGPSVDALRRQVDALRIPLEGGGEIFTRD